MADVIHDPLTDWCACEPHSMDRCDYRLLADKVIDELNPPDGDEAEVSICFNAIEDAAVYIQQQPCTCTPAMVEDGSPCPRCAALGRIGDTRMDR